MAGNYITHMQPPEIRAFFRLIKSTTFPLLLLEENVQLCSSFSLNSTLPYLRAKLRAFCGPIKATMMPERHNLAEHFCAGCVTCI